MPTDGAPLGPSGRETDDPGSRRGWRRLARRGLLMVAVLAFYTVIVWNVTNTIRADVGQQRAAEQGNGAGDEVAVTIAATGDIGGNGAGRATLEAMAAAEPDLYLGLGDLSYGGPGSEQDWCDLVHDAIGPVAPFEIVPGNHEDDDGADGHVGNFADCLPDRMNATGTYPTQYTFDIGDLARIIMISPDLTVDGTHYFYGEGNARQEWVRQTVREAREADIRWVIVGMHKNCISTGVYYCNVHQDLFSTLLEEGVDLVLSGHDHTYQRSRQLAVGRPGCPSVILDDYDADCVADDGEDDGYGRGDGTVFVVAAVGGGGEADQAFYDVDADDPEAGYFVATMGANTEGRRHGFARLRLTGDELAVEFVPSSGGSFTDEFTIAAGDAGPG